jgi:exoribonuclease II
MAASPQQKFQTSPEIPSIPNILELADRQRVDLTDVPFLAIDAANVHNADDAIFVKRHRNGCFVVMVAIADGLQLADYQDRIPVSITEQPSGNSNFKKKLSLNDAILGSEVSNLTLSGGGKRSVLVIAQDFRADMELGGEPAIFHATAEVEAIDYDQLAVRCQTSRGHTREKILRAFDSTYKATHNLKPALLSGVQTPDRINIFGNELVQTYMVIANMAAAKWGSENDVPIIYRHFRSELHRWGNSIGTIFPAGVRQSREPLPAMPKLTADKTDYAYATSPLWRVVDLINHLQIGYSLTGQDVPFNQAALQVLTEQLSDRKQPLAA